VVQESGIGVWWAEGEWSPSLPEGLEGVAMGEEPREFWNIDLTKLTWSGWLLILVTVGTALSVMIAVVGLLHVLGFQRDPTQTSSGRWVGAVALVPGLAIGSGVFAGGKWLFERAGCPILRTSRR
jgi:hypothetical protein